MDTHVTPNKQFQVNLQPSVFNNNCFFTIHSTITGSQMMQHANHIVSVPGLQCIKCTWNDVETSNFVLNTFINGLEKLSSQHCKVSD